MEIKLKESPEIWDEFVRTSPQRSIFVYSKFLDSLGTKYDLVTCYESEKIVAGAVVLLENEEPIQHVFPFTQYQGILLSDNATLTNHSRQSIEFKTLEFFISNLMEHYNKLCLCQSWQFCDMRPLQWFNYHEPEKGTFKIALRYTAILDLTKFNNINDYLNSIRKVRRQEVTKAQKNLKVVEINDEKILDDLHEKTFERQGIKRDPHESVLVRNITKNALEKGFGRLTAVFIDNIPVAANLFVFDDKTGYYLFGANHPDYRNTCAGTLLLANAIEDAMARNLQEVDFVGANSPNRGDFKLSFNPELKPYFIATYTN